MPYRQVSSSELMIYKFLQIPQMENRFNRQLSGLIPDTWVTSSNTVLASNLAPIACYGVARIFLWLFISMCWKLTIWSNLELRDFSLLFNFLVFNFQCHFQKVQNYSCSTKNEEIMAMHIWKRRTKSARSNIFACLSIYQSVWPFFSMSFVS